MIRGLLVRLAREGGKTVFLTTHNMAEAERLCDRVAIINKGRIIVEGRPAELKRLVADYVPLIIRGWGDIDAFRKAAEEYNLRLAVKPRGGYIEARFLAPLGEEEKLLAALVSRLVSLGVRVAEARVEEPTLEDVFIKFTGGAMEGV